MKRTFWSRADFVRVYSFVTWYFAPWFTVLAKTEIGSYEWRFEQANYCNCDSPFKLDSWRCRMSAYVKIGGGIYPEHKLEDPDAVFAFLVNSSDAELAAELSTLEEHWASFDDEIGEYQVEYSGTLKWWRPRRGAYYYSDTDPDRNDFPTVGLLRTGLH